MYGLPHESSIRAALGFNQSRADIIQLYPLLLYSRISIKFFVAAAEGSAQASQWHYKFVSGSLLPVIQKHEKNILCKEGLKSAWRGEAEGVTVSFRHLFMANSKENWNWGNLCKWSIQSEVRLLFSHRPCIPAISDKPETENEPETFVRTGNKRNSVWQECGDCSQAECKPEHEERSPFSDLGMGKHRNPT